MYRASCGWLRLLALLVFCCIFLAVLTELYATVSRHFRRPCSDFTDMLRRLANCRIIIIYKKNTYAHKKNNHMRNKLARLIENTRANLAQCRVMWAALTWQPYDCIACNYSDITVIVGYIWSMLYDTMNVSLRESCIGLYFNVTSSSGS